jgi:hypothetical protein
MQDTFEFAAQAIGHALGVSVVLTTPFFGPKTVEGVLSSGFTQVSSGDVRVDSRRLEVDVAVAELDTSSTELEKWKGGTLEFLEGPLAGEITEIAKARPGAEGAFVTLTLKRTG